MYEAASTKMYAAIRSGHQAKMYTMKSHPPKLARADILVRDPALFPGPQLFLAAWGGQVLLQEELFPTSYTNYSFPAFYSGGLG